MDATRRTVYVLVCIAVLCECLLCEECPSNDKESILQNGYSYIYQYKSEAFGEAVGTTNDRTRMTLECEVSITHKYDCLYKLQLNVCTLSAVGGPTEEETPWIDQKKIEDLSRYPVVFSLHNGEVKDLYSNNDDAIYNINIKRGVLSAFTFKRSMTSETMHGVVTDIQGTCPFESVIVSDSIVKTSKNMMNCAFPSRPDWQFSPWSLFWNMSFIQYQMNSTVDCEYEIDNSKKNLEKVYCHERHAIGLESTHQTTTAVQTNIYYQMLFVKSQKVTTKSTKSLPSRRSGIQFEYESTPDPTLQSEPRDFLVKAQKMLSDLVDASKDEIQLFTIPMFTDFVAWLRSSYNLKPFIASVRDGSFVNDGIVFDKLFKNLSMSYLSDALVQCQTVPCFEAVSNLAINGDLSESYINFVLYSWTNMHFTKPEIINHIMAICEHRDTRFCWLSFGTVVKQYVHRISLVSAGVKKVKEVDKVIHHFAKQIDESCNPAHPFDWEMEKYKRLIYFKAIGNVGKAFFTYSPHTLHELGKCIHNVDLPMYVRISAVEIFSHVDLCEEDACLPIILSLETVFVNMSEHVPLRLAAYELLITMPEAYDFEKKLMHVLKVDRNTQILSFISSDLIYRLKDQEYQKANPNFVHKMRNLLEHEDIQLESLQQLEEGNSYSEVFGKFFKVPYLPHNLNGFGAKSYFSKIYSKYYSIPELFQSGVTLELFNKVIELFSISGQAQNWQKVAMILLQHFDKTSDNALSELIDVVKKSLDTRIYGFHLRFNETIIENIKTIYSKYKWNRLSEFPFVDFNLQMFGSTLNYLLLEDILAAGKVSSYIPNIIWQLHEGIKHNNTRVIRIIEAYNQVPTMMGLALNWTTNATLGFSIRKGLQLHFTRYSPHLDDLHINGSGFIYPSAALTFLNRMVLDYPGITQIGIQANSSAYTSTQFKAQLQYSNMEKILKVEVPRKPQKILQLFRTNQIIKHTSYDDIPDWDIQRTSVDWCLRDGFSAVTGFELCHERTYPNVTHRIKPWALMAGSCKWSLILNPMDRHLASYNFEWSRSFSGNAEKLKFSAPGTSLKREVNADIYRNAYGEFRMRTSIPELPEFYVLFDHKIPHENDHQIDYRDQINVDLSDVLKYELTHQHSMRKTQKDEASDEIKKVAISEQYRELTLKTPFNIYNYSQENEQHGKTHMMISYRNLNSDWNFMADILPATFWESDSYASLSFLLDSETSLKSGKYLGRVTTAGSVAELKATRSTSTSEQQVEVMLAKSDTASKKLLGFLNFVYKFESLKKDDSSSREKRELNVTTPLRSWNLLLESSFEKLQTLHNATFTSARRIPKNKENVEVVWWSDGESLDFDLKESEVKFKANIKTSLPSNAEILEQFADIREHEIEGLQNQYTTADLNLYYPTKNIDEAVKFKGKFLVSMSTNTFRFQKDFALMSTHRDLQLDSHSVFAMMGDSKLTKISHNSYFTHHTSGTQAFYNMELQRLFNSNQCMEVDFSHNITSHVYNMASNVSYHCTAENNKQHKLVLNLDSDSPYWDMLNMQIKQIINDHTPKHSHETMNFSSPFMKINVIATWDEDEHKKEAIFSLPTGEQIFRINKHATGSRRNTIEFTFPDRESKLTYARILSDDFKKLKVNIYYPDKESKVLDLHGNIVKPNDRIWKVELYPGLLSLSDLLVRMVQHASSNVLMVAHDSNHPINRMLQPALKMNLAQYIEGIRKEIKMTIAQTSMEVIGSLKPFSDPYLSIMKNLSRILSDQYLKFYAIAERKSILIWAVNYFELRQHLQKQYIYDMLKAYLFPYQKEDMKEGFPLETIVYRAGDLVDWESFDIMPRLAQDRLNKKLNTKSEHKIENHHKKKDENRIGLIFGPRHVYTFDGHLYAVPDYPSKSCTYLLAYDVYSSSFAVLATAEFIHVLFPNVTVSVNSRDEVYIDDSKIPESLPFQSKSGFVMVTRENRITLVHSPALTIICDGGNFLCVIEMTGWSGGGTIGLLGNANGEDYDDFFLPNGTTTSDVLEFIRSYELSGTKDCQNLETLPSPPDADVFVKRLCKKSVSNVCSFYNHLKQRFNEQCLTFDKDDYGNVCYTETALSALCYNKEQEMKSNCYVEKQYSTRIQHELQVVFIVDQHKSMLSEGKESNFIKSIERIVNEIDKQFRSNAFDSISYSLVGFGGKDVRLQPSVHTVGSKVRVPYDQVPSLLKTLKLTGTDTHDPVLAVKYSAEVLGHDTFNTKVFIVITQKDQQNTTKDILHLVQAYLNRNHITLYTLAAYPSIDKSRKVYGIRADGLIFPKTDKGEDFMDYPKGDMAKITSGTRGSLFLKKFMDNQQSRNSFFTELANEVFSKVRREHQFCRKCTTVRSGWWYYQNECSLENCET